MMKKYHVGIIMLIALVPILMLPLLEMTGMVTYVVNNTANRSLTIWHDGENRPFHYVDEDISFYANFTNITSNLTVDDGNCSIYFDASGTVMLENGDNISDFIYERNFSTAGEYDYNISCIKEGETVYLTASDTITVKSECGSGFNLYEEYNPTGNIYCDKLYLFLINDTNSGCNSGVPPFLRTCWDIFDNVTLYLPDNLSTSTGLNIVLDNSELLTREWADATCNSTRVYNIHTVFENSSGDCYLNKTLNLSETSIAPNLNLTYPNITNLIIGENGPFNITIENIGDDNATDVVIILDTSNETRATISVINNISSILVNGIDYIFFNITSFKGGNLSYLNHSIINYTNSYSTKYSLELKQVFSQNIHVNYDPIWVLDIPDLSLNTSYSSASSTVDLSTYFQDNDTYDNCSSVNWSLSGRRSDNVSVDLLTTINTMFEFLNCTLTTTINNNWTGRIDLNVTVIDTYNQNATTNMTIYVSNGTNDTCNGVDDDGDTDVDEDFVSDDCCAYSSCSNPLGYTICTNGTIICENSTRARTTSSSGGGSAATTEEEDEVEEEEEPLVEEEPEPEKPPVKEKPAQQSSESRMKELVLEELISNAFKIRRNIQVFGGRTKITESVRNLDLLARNLNLQMTIPKEIADNTDEVIQITPFEVVEYDPIIGFTTKIQSYKEESIEFALNKELTLDEVADIISQIIEDEEESERLKEEIRKKIEETSKVINLTQSYEIKGNKTTLTIDIDIDKTKGLVNVSIFQEIPKCLVEIINEQMIESENKDYEIINADPLIVWHFDNILDAEKIQYTIDAVADENCTDQLNALAVAKEIRQVMQGEKIDYYKLGIAVSIIPIIALIMIIFGLVTTKIKHRDEEVNKLTEYVRKLYRNGYGKYKIKDMLIKEGYHLGVIDECLHLHTVSKFHYWVHRLEIGFDEMILIALILLNILDFTEQLPGDIDYLKKIISWVLLAYLLFRSSITSVLFGERKKIIDLSLILIFFSFTFKNIIAYAKVATDEVDFVLHLYAYLVNNNIIFEKHVFIGGIIALLLISLYIALRTKIKEPSFLSTVHVKGDLPEGPLQILWRFIVVHLTLILFFVLIFNLMMEWLAIAVDALILVLTLLIMVFMIVKHHKKLTPARFMEDTSSAAEKFYERFVDLFHYKKTIYLGISGMLILHALTEVGNFIIPYFIGVHDAIYFGNFNMGHMPLFSWMEESLFSLQTAGFGIGLKFSVGYAYVMNIIALLLLFIIPAMIWFNYFKHRKLPVNEVPKFRMTSNHFVNSLMLGLFSGSLVMFFIKPVFTLKSLLGGESLAGVDILTHQIGLNMLNEVILVSVGVAILMFLIALFFERVMNYVMMPISYGFFGYYVFLFGKSIALYNLNEFSIKISLVPIIAVYTFMFGMLAVVLLYCGGFLINSYLYMPHWVKEIIRGVPLLGRLFEKHDYHHIHFYEKHDALKHDKEEETIKKYIYKSLESGHELFYVVEHLVDHNWPVELIEEAIEDVKHEDLFKTDVKKVMHYHHNKDNIHTLAEWINGMYKEHGMKDIIESALKFNWTEDDVILAFRILKGKLKIKEGDEEIIKYMYVVN